MQKYKFNQYLNLHRKASLQRIIKLNLILFILFLFCRAPQSDQIKVFVSILPQKYFVERVGGDRLEVSVMVGPGMSPATYEPLPRQMLALAEAQVYFQIGVPFETAWIEKFEANYPHLKIVDTRTGIQLRPMESFDEIVSNLNETVFPDSIHSDEEKHHHSAGKDPHIWLSPNLVKIQAETICKTLCEIQPAQQTFFQANLDRFKRDLDTLNTEIAQILATIPVKKLMVFHPAWGYFARQFGFQQIPIEIEGKEPTPGQLADIIQFAKREQIKVIFVQSQFNTKSAENYLENLKNIARTMAQSFQNNY